MSGLVRGALAWCALVVAVGCGGSSADGPGGEGGGGSGVDASADCEGCRILLTDIEQPFAPTIVGTDVYVEDWGAGKLLRVPLAGGEAVTVAEGLVAHVFAVTADRLYFWANVTADDAYYDVFSVGLSASEAELWARYQHGGAVPMGVADGTPVVRGRTDDGSTVLSRVEKDGKLTSLRQWPSAAESPFAGALALLPSGELLWGDAEDGVWAAPSVSADAVHEPSGFRVVGIEESGGRVLLTNLPSAVADGKSRAFVRSEDGALNEVAVNAAERIGSPAFLVPGGVVAVSSNTGQILLSRADGTSATVASSQGKLSMNPEGLSATDEVVVFIAHLGAEKWSLYRVAAPD